MPGQAKTVSVRTAPPTSLSGLEAGERHDRQDGVAGDVAARDDRRARRPWPAPSGRSRRSPPPASRRASCGHRCAVKNRPSVIAGRIRWWPMSSARAQAGIARPDRLVADVRHEPELQREDDLAHQRDPEQRRRVEEERQRGDRRCPTRSRPAVPPATPTSDAEHERDDRRPCRSAAASPAGARRSASTGSAAGS